MSTKPRDTSPEAWQIRRTILEEMDCERRVITAIDLSEAIREIQLDGLLARNPTWNRARGVRHLVLTQHGIDMEFFP